MAVEGPGMEIQWIMRGVCATVLAGHCSSVVAAQCEVGKLLPLDEFDHARFGTSVAVSGSFIVVGRPGELGSAYLFEITENGAILARVLVADDGVIGDGFGQSVDIEGDVVIVGADEVEDDQGMITGAVYVFCRDAGADGEWGQVAKLAPDDDQVFRFGQAVAISGDTFVGGAPASIPDGGRDNVGAAYVFQHEAGDPSTWKEVAKLQMGGEVGEFGGAVDIDGDTAIVGDFREPVAGLDQSGAAYVFERNEGGEDTWGQVAELTSDDPEFGAKFGFSVAVGGSTAFVGAPTEDNPPNLPNAGCVYVFDGAHDDWVQTEKFLMADFGGGSSSFGGSVAIEGDIALIGHYGANLSTGMVFVLRRVGGGFIWSQVMTLTASDGEEGDKFGVSAGVDGELVVVGSFLDDGRAENSGSAYVFDVRLSDIDGDCFVGPHDLILLLGAWGDCPAPENCHNCHMDLDGDCTIGTSDLLILLGAWGPCPK